VDDLIKNSYSNYFVVVSVYIKKNLLIWRDGMATKISQTFAQYVELTIEVNNFY